jgi:hypothetical protein
MSKFVVNNLNCKNPVLQADQMVTHHYSDGTSVSTINNGMLTNGTVMLPVSGTIKRYKDGRIEVNGALIDWEAVVARQQQQPLKLPEAIPDEPLLQDGENECLICAERSIKTVLNECGHQVYCVTCARATVNQDSLCPMCRAPIRSVIRCFPK